MYGNATPIFPSHREDVHSHYISIPEAAREHKQETHWAPAQLESLVLDSPPDNGTDFLTMDYHFLPLPMHSDRNVLEATNRRVLLQFGVPSWLSSPLSLLPLPAGMLSPEGEHSAKHELDDRRDLEGRSPSFTHVRKGHSEGLATRAVNAIFGRRRGCTQLEGVQTLPPVYCSSSPEGDLAELPTTHNCAKKSQWARPGRDAVNGGAQRRRKVCTLRVQHVKRITILAAILVMLIALLAHGLMMRDCAVFRSRAHCFAPRPRLHAKWGGNVRNVVPVSVVPHRFETTFRADALELINTTSLVSELHRNQSIMSNSGTVSDRYLHHTMSVDNRHFLLMPSNKLLHSKPLLVHKKRYDVLGVTDTSDHPTPQPSAVDSSKSTTTTTTTRAPPQSLDRVRVAILSAYNDTNSFSCIAHASAILSGIPIINVGYRKAYSHIDRFNDYVRFLEVEMMSDSDVVIAMDSDIVFTGIDVRDYIQQFIDTTAATADDLDAVAVRTGRATAPIVFPAEKYCIRKQLFQGFDDCAAEYEAYEQRVSDEAITHGYAFESNLGGRRNPFRFLNGGTIVARVWALKELHAAMKSFMKVHVPTYYPQTWFCDQTIISSLFIRLLGIELDAGLMRIALLEGEIEAAEQRREALDRLIATTTTMTSRHYLMFQGRILSRWLIDNYATRHRLRKTLEKARLQPYDLRPGLIGLDTTSEFVFSSSEEAIYKTDFKETPYVQHACLRCAPRKNSGTTEVNDRTEEYRSIGMEDSANLGLATWRVMESAQSLVRLIGSAMDAIMTPYLINPLYSIVVGSGSKTLPPRCAETDLLKEFHANRSTWRDPQAYLWLSLSESEEGVERYRHFYTSAFSDEPPVVSYETEQLLLRHYLAAEDQSLGLPHSSSTHGLGSLLMDRRRRRQMVLSSASQEATGVGGASRSRTGAVISPGAIDVTSYPPLYVLLVRPTTESGGQDGAADALRRALMHAPANIPIDLLPAGNTTDGPTADLTAAEEAAWLFGTSIVMPSADDHHPQHRRAHTSGGGLFDVSNKHSKAYAIRTFQMRLQNIRAFQLKRGLAQNANLRKHGSSNREGGVGELFPSPAEQGQDAEDGVCGAPRDVDVSLEMYAKSHPIGFHFSGGWKEYNYDTYKYFYSWNIPIRFSFVSSRRSRSILGGAHLIMWEDNSTQLYPYVDMCGTPV